MMEGVEISLSLSNGKELKISGIDDPRILDIPERENGEAFVQVHHPKIWRPSELDTPIGVDDGSMIVRSSVAKALYKAADRLSPLFGLVLVEGYRPYEYQLELFQQEVERLRIEARGSLSQDTLEARARQFVSDPRLFSPHVTGGAVDVSLVGITHLRGRTERLIADMGNVGFAYGETSRTDYHTGSLLADTNRQLLHQVMTASGFTNYPWEFWHFSMGDRLDALAKGTVARFGAVQNPYIKK